MQMDQKNNFGEPGYNTIKKKLHGLVRIGKGLSCSVLLYQSCLYGRSICVACCDHQEDFKDQASQELNDHHERLRHLETQSTEAGDNTSQLLQAMHDKILAEVGSLYCCNR